MTIYENNVDARSLRTNAQAPNVQTNADNFGAGGARALGALAQGVEQEANNYKLRVEKAKEKRDAASQANMVALFDFSQEEQSLKDDYVEGYTEEARVRYQNRVADYTNGIESDRVRAGVRESLLAKLPALTARAATYEEGAINGVRKAETDAALDATLNQAHSDPSAYASALEQGEDIIAAQIDIPLALRREVAASWGQKVARSHLKGRIASTEDPAMLGALEEEMANDKAPWLGVLDAKTFEDLASEVSAKKSRILKQRETTARAWVGELESRASKDPTRILPAADIDQAGIVARLSGDPALQARVARLSRTNDTVRMFRQASPNQIRRRSAQVRGEGGSYPGIPLRVNDAIERASRVTGMGVKFLGGTALREYGQYLKPGAAAESKYKPRILDASLSEKGLPPKIASALRGAGSVLGSPLSVVSGESFNLKGDSATILMGGLSPEQRASTLGALIDAGFSGVEQEGDKLTVSFADKIPASYSDDWSGWSRLDPGLQQVLKERRYEAGADSRSITRNPLPSLGDGVDYGKGTQIQKADGTPSSGAVGVAQFIPSTFLSVMRSGALDREFDKDFASMGDAELLALRKDPEVSIMAAAVLGKQNSAYLERALGRTATDGETYAAHFLGAPAAASLIERNRNSPSLNAAELFPAAAAANRPVFYDKNGKPRTVGGVYEHLTSSFDLAPGNVSYEDAEVLDSMATAAEKELKDDPLTYAARVGSHIIEPLTKEPASFVRRGAEASEVASYNDLSLQDMKPFTASEMSRARAVLEGDSLDDKLDLLGNIAQMGSMKEQALKQIGSGDATAAYAGSLYADGRPEVARSVLKGQMQLQKDPQTRTRFELTPANINDAFEQAAGNALNQVKPALRASVREAATSLYVDKKLALGESAWDSKVYDSAVQEVLGGDGADVKAVDSFNGVDLLMPGQYSADELEDAVGALRDIDLIALSRDGTAPLYSNGAPALAQDIRDELTFNYLGGDAYSVSLSDGSVLLSGSSAPGKARLYTVR